jgi:hypothetical protein
MKMPAVFWAAGILTCDECVSCACPLGPLAFFSYGPLAFFSYEGWVSSAVSSAVSSSAVSYVNSRLKAKTK